MTSDPGVERSIIQSSFTFEQIYELLSRRWWWLAGAMVFGALIGLVLSLLLPAGFQATASLGIGIDYGRTHSLERETERQALLQVQDLLLSDEVLEAALDNVEDASMAGSEISGAAALRENIRVDRFEGRWDLSVFSPEPMAAAALANAWSDASINAIEGALNSAWRARALQLEVYELGCQLEYQQETASAVLRCQRGTSEEAEEIHDELLAATQRSHGLLPALTFGQLRQATVPTKPVYRSIAWLTLGGLFVGLAVGLTALLAIPYRRPLPKSKEETDRRQPARIPENQYD